MASLMRRCSETVTVGMPCASISLATRPAVRLQRPQAGASSTMSARWSRNSCAMAGAVSLVSRSSRGPSM